MPKEVMAKMTIKIQSKMLLYQRKKPNDEVSTAAMNSADRKANLYDFFRRMAIVPTRF